MDRGGHLYRNVMILGTNYFIEFWENMWSTWKFKKIKRRACLLFKLFRIQELINKHNRVPTTSP